MRKQEKSNSEGVRGECGQICGEVFVTILWCKGEGECRVREMRVKIRAV